MKRFIYLSCLLGACNMSASDGNALSADSVNFSYQIVGGKPGAPLEQLQIDCASKQATLSRQTQEKTPVYRHQTAVSAAQCTELARLAESLCSNVDKREAAVFDAAGYTLNCRSGDLPAATFSWQGTLRSAPAGLRPWHDYTRGLIKAAFPGVNYYP